VAVFVAAIEYVKALWRFVVARLDSWTDRVSTEGHLVFLENFAMDEQSKGPFLFQD